MKFIIGIVIVVSAVFGGYWGAGGHLAVLWQPFEFVIILGAAIGALVIGNPPAVLKGLGRTFKIMLKGPKYKKDSYLELLGLQYTLFKLAKAKGSLALEAHVENPAESDLFNKFPTIASDPRALEFMCDYLRLVTLGTENAHEVEALMDEELETLNQEDEQMVAAIQALADGTPALGIVAAVLGVIHTMGAIDQPPVVLGAKIGSALVGTFLGVFLAYGLVGPFASRLKGIYDEEAIFYHIIQNVLVAHLHGNAAQISVEIGRGNVPSAFQPSFLELEEALSAAPAE